ncbi:hypothetical protein FRUB_10169 [Fimbriiglobus ruber]|uniref:Uncharacterized protein n=1 Tax=Fimbriiglobus ruber TaxID=1908690 RepID=A0A225D6P6_9BACT|nr:hypothetical protein FRUB_10169 [Fimbriiglobus ruber]
MMNAVTPKGVDHDEMPRECFKFKRVMNAVTPKGVDHNFYNDRASVWSE